MHKFVVYTLITIFMIAGGLAILFGFWWLWTWAMPQIWPTGPAALVNPSYWLFVVIWLLASWVGSTIFGRSKS